MPKKIKYNPADRIADLAVVRMQDRIKEIYAEAERDITRKMNEFTQKFEKRDAQYRADVAAGKIAQADYDAWRRGQVFQGEQWKAAKREMTAQIRRANQTAAGIVNGERRAVFQKNANYAAYQIEKRTKGAVNFSLYDSATVTRLLKEDKKLLPEYKINEVKDYKWNNSKVNNAVTQSIIQGESFEDLTKRLTHSLEAGNRSTMMTFARTAMTGAQNAGRIEAMHDAEDMGIKVQKRWIATLDSRTRDTHAELDGQVVDVDKPFEVDGMEIMYPGDPNADPALVYNCFIGETNIATDSKIIRSYKHDYSGKLIEVETSSGVKFTCTPNHPILTPSGWVPAALMNNGDNLLIASVRNGCGLRRNGNIQHIHARMKALYNALHRVGLMSRDSTLRVDFHGDTPTADVEVITKKWHLRGNGDSSSADSVDKFLLENSDKSLMSKGASVQHFGRVRLAALRFVRGFCKVPAFFGRGLAHAVIHGFGTVARNDTAILEPQADSMTGDMQFLRESLDRFPGKVFVDNIVNINITTVSHIPVYNLQTGNSRYFVNTIIEQNGEKCNGNFAIAHNCRCTLGYEYPDVATGIGRRRDNETGEVVGDMTYREWEEIKRGEEAEPIDTPEPELEQQGEDDSFAGRLASEKLSPYSYELDYFEYAEQMQAWDGDRTQWIESVHPGTVIDMQTERTFDGEPHCSFAPIDNAVARLYEQVPLTADHSNLVLCDYDNARFHLPNGEDDRRLTVDAIAQVFENEGQTVIAFRRDWMNHSLKESLEERQRMIDEGQVLPMVFPVASPEGVVMHEWGHTVHSHFLNAMCYDDPDAQELWNWYKTLSKEDITTGLSEYAAVNFGEFTAECFAEMQTSNPRPLARQCWQYMSGLIGRGY